MTSAPAERRLQHLVHVLSSAVNERIIVPQRQTAGVTLPAPGRPTVIIPRKHTTWATRVVAHDLDVPRLAIAVRLLDASLSELIDLCRLFDCILQCSTCSKDDIHIFSQIAAMIWVKISAWYTGPPFPLVPAHTLLQEVTPATITAQFYRRMFRSTIPCSHSLVFIKDMLAETCIIPQNHTQHPALLSDTAGQTTINSIIATQRTNEARLIPENAQLSPPAPARKQAVTADKVRPRATQTNGRVQRIKSTCNTTSCAALTTARKCNRTNREATRTRINAARQTCNITLQRPHITAMSTPEFNAWCKSAGASVHDILLMRASRRRAKNAHYARMCRRRKRD
jgi:hypothetical protein